MCAEKIIDEHKATTTVSVSSHATLRDVIELSTSKRRMYAGVAGPVLLGIGSGISISAGFGSFGFSVLLDGIYDRLSVPLWISQTLMTFMFYVAAWFWGGIRLGIGTLPSLLLIGPAISLGAGIAPDVLSFWWHAGAFAMGLFLFSLGISLSAAAALGPDGVTALSLAAEKRWRWSIPKANFVWNFSAIALGASLGGNLGPATIAGLICTPPLIRILLPPLRRYISTHPASSSR